ncbi:hypothetical protein B0T22DRAFT_164100 [Podospora appendiculata]|uniref:Uncharacterized protein n=1 Tax=Podospora appendiculata TaxID=314037 RepID=A0AAE0XA70_9PEZI|nr:hypothetical protein B0T22DRAFT_164100 [Podospora appendiculata]
MKTAEKPTAETTRRTGAKSESDRRACTEYAPLALRWMSAVTAPYPERRHETGTFAKVGFPWYGSCSKPPTLLPTPSATAPCTYPVLYLIRAWPGLGQLGVCPDSRMPHSVLAIDHQSAIACFQVVLVHACTHCTTPSTTWKPGSLFPIFTQCRYRIFTCVCISHSRPDGPKTLLEMFSFSFSFPSFDTGPRRSLSQPITMMLPSMARHPCSTLVSSHLLHQTHADTQNQPSHHIYVSVSHLLLFVDAINSERKSKAPGNEPKTNRRKRKKTTNWVHWAIQIW